MENRCVCCGEIIPEGIQACNACYNFNKLNTTRNIPCKPNCADRSITCHSTCAKYKVWFAAKQEAKLNTYNGKSKSRMFDSYKKFKLQKEKSKH